MSNRLRRTAAALSCLLMLAACGKAPPPYTGGDVGEFQRVDVVEGTGDIARAGEEVSVHYTGWLYDQNAADRRG